MKDLEKVRTESGSRGRIVMLQGTPRQCADAYFMLNEAVLDCEADKQSRIKDTYYK